MNISNNNKATNNDDNTLEVIEPLQTMRTADNNDKICKDSASKSNYNDDGVCEMNDMLQNMSTDDKDSNVSLCANCGKEGANNICNKCQQVKYCNAVCKKVHKKKHKKDCEEHTRRAAELHDIELFKQPPPHNEDCPICFLRLPTLEEGRRYQSCCGKVICSGCSYAPVYDNQGNEVDNDKCPFCRTLDPDSNEEAIKRIMKRVKAGDAEALYNVGCHYQEGSYGLPRDIDKALELFHRAGELGHANAYCSIGAAYESGTGVEVDNEKAVHYYELGAIRGDIYARYNLGLNEEEAGNTERALKHWMVAVKAGDNDSLKEIKDMYSEGDASKEDYMKALQLYQEYLSEIKSDQRDKAAAASESYRYY